MLACYDSGSIVSGALLRQGITAVFGSGSYLHALVFPLLVLCSLLVLILLIRYVVVCSVAVINSVCINCNTATEFVHMDLQSRVCVLPRA